jgi:hypothetical protein
MQFQNGRTSWSLSSTSSCRVFSLVVSWLILAGRHCTRLFLVHRRRVCHRTTWISVWLHANGFLTNCFIVYVNSLLATLNGRDSMSDRASSKGTTSQSTGVNSFPLEHLNLHSHPVALGLENNKAPQVETGRKSRNSVTHDSIYENDISDRVERGVKTRGPAYVSARATASITLYSVF